MEKVKNNNEKKYGEKMQNKVRRGEERKVTWGKNKQTNLNQSLSLEYKILLM